MDNKIIKEIMLETNQDEATITLILNAFRDITMRNIKIAIAKDSIGNVKEGPRGLVFAELDQIAKDFGFTDELFDKDDTDKKIN